MIVNGAVVHDVRRWRMGRLAVLGSVLTLTFSGLTVGSFPSAASAAPAVCFTRTLRAGSSGSDVALLQTGLQFVGMRPGRVTGYFGNATRNAWKRWERAMGYRVDGIAQFAELSWGACVPPVAAPPVTTTPATPQVAQSAAPAPVQIAVATPPIISAPPTTTAPTSTAPASTAPVATAAPATLPDAVLIPSLSMERPIIVAYDSQRAIDSCRGAVLYAGDWPGSSVGMYLAAHRTSCGSMGFNGIQNLPAGAAVVVRRNGAEHRYTVRSVHTARAGDVLVMPPAGTVVLQTTKSGSVVWVVTATAG